MKKFSRNVKRDVHGILLLDKPKGKSSNEVLQNVKKIYHANRAGHTGSLDPIATGMLPICFGKATKCSQILLNSDKSYRVIAKLGQRTDTFDSSGKIVEEIRLLNLNIQYLKVTLKSFLGVTFQNPPVYSALKYRGRRLYDYARKKIEVPLKIRLITIYKLLFIRYENCELELEILCSKGTYIRAIVNDIGKKLGCGAHVIYLRRLTVDRFSPKKMVTIEYLHALVKREKKEKIKKNVLLDSLLIPIEKLK